MVQLPNLPEKQEELARGDLPAWFTEISREQRIAHEKLAERVIRLGGLVEALSLGGELYHRVTNALAQALHLLDYTRPYNISVIGMSGVGKSTLINALLGRDLLPSRHGMATTGTIVTVSQTLVEGGEQPLRRALVDYHTLETLSELVKALCAKLNITPLFTDERENQIELNQMLKLLQSLVVCPSDNHINPPGSKRCAECGAKLENIRRHTSRQLPPELVMLEDLLQTALHQRVRLEQNSGPIAIPLNNLDDVRRVQALMDEESPTNKKGSTSRIIPLIRRIDYQLSSWWADNEHEALTYINLTDTPGTAALTVAHDEQLRQQLNPFATDAIILVMKPERPEAMLREMLPLIENLLMSGLKADERHLIAERTFLVVNKGDEIAPESAEEATKDVRQGVEKVGDRIVKGFCSDFPEHVFYNVKAQPALIAELVRSYPQPAKIWLRGENDPHFRFNVEYYLNVSARALTFHANTEREEAVLRWSSIRELRHRLKTFLSRRWEQDLNKAQTLYNNAHEALVEHIDGEWEGLTGRPLSSYPQVDLETLNKGLALRYAQELRSLGMQVLQRFRQACSHLRAAQRTGGGAEPELETLRQAIQQKIVAYTDTTEFKHAIMSTIEHPIFGSTMDWAGAPQPLVDLDTLIYGWIDGQVRQVASSMMNKLRQALEQAQVENALREAFYQVATYESYQTAYQQRIYAEMQNQYEHACRGAMLYQMMTRRVVDEIRGDPEFRAAITNSVEQGKKATTTETATLLVAKIREKYNAAHTDLIRTMPVYLTALFFYHLTDAEKKLVTLIDDLISQLSVDVGDINGALYRQIQASESSQAARRARFVEQWQELQALK